MKRFSKLLVAILVVSVLVVTGCEKKNPMVGEYELYEMKSEDFTISKDELAQFGMSMTLVVNDDNTFEIKYDGEASDLTDDDGNEPSEDDLSQKGTYDDEKFTIEDESINYKFEDDTITLIDENDGDMIFKRK